MQSELVTDPSATAMKILQKTREGQAGKNKFNRLSGGRRKTKVELDEPIFFQQPPYTESTYRRCD